MKDFFNKTINDAIEKIFNVSLIFYNDYKNGFFFQSQIKWDGGNINLKIFYHIEITILLHLLVCMQKIFYLKKKVKKIVSVKKIQTEALP